MKYRTQYDKRDREAFRSCPGRQEYEVYIADENGDPIVSGIRNRYDEIQSHRESVELSVLLQRYALGDESALNQRVGQYVDVSDAPESYAAFVDQLKTMESDFFSLPPEFREMFGNDPLSYWKAIGTETYMQKVEDFLSLRDKSRRDSILHTNDGDNSDNKSGGERSNINEQKSE